MKKTVAYIISEIIYIYIASLVAQTVKRLPTMRETWVWSLDWEVPLEKEMTTHSSIFSWKIPWMEEPGRLQSMGSQRVRQDWETSLHIYIYDINIYISHRGTLEWTKMWFSTQDLEVMLKSGIFVLPLTRCVMLWGSMFLFIK